MMNHDPMKDALKRRKMQGVDISIIVEPQDEREKNTDLAPAGEEQEAKLEQGELEGQMKQGEGSDLDMLGELTSDMSDHEKMMAQDPERKPLSLGARARMDALAKMKHGK